MMDARPGAAACMRRLAPGWLALGTLLLGGCATVAPWERGNLARPQMAAEPHPLQRAAREHVYGSREATAAGAAAAGGGCGCY